MMAAARTLKEMDDLTRELYLFDTFEGMVPPSDLDRRFDEVGAAALLEADERHGPESVWCFAGLKEVEAALALVDYPTERVHFIEGRVEDTVPSKAPDRIAILCLDTDWYESTRHELVHLFPRISPGGVLILDDYGFWLGARKAVDEFLESLPVPLLLHRVDDNGRVAVISQH